MKNAECSTAISIKNILFLTDFSEPSEAALHSQPASPVGTRQSLRSACLYSGSKCSRRSAKTGNRSH